MQKSTRREFALQFGGAAAAMSLGQAVGVREARAATRGLQLSIDIMGLNALVLDRAARRAELLFVDPRGLGMSKHTPILVANMSDVTNAEGSKPTTVTVIPAASGRGVQQLGLWDLTDTQLVVRTAGGGELADGVMTNSGPEDVPVGAPADPDNPEAWRDLRYVVDMKRICGQGEIATGLSSLGSRNGAGNVPSVVAGRLRFSGGLLEGAIPSWEQHRRDVFEFRQTGGRPAVSQHVTDTVHWTATNTNLEGNYLALDLVPLRGRTGASRTLMLAQRGMACRLAVSNLPADSAADAHHGVGAAEMAALHFGVYYRLLANPPVDRPLPRPWLPPAARAGAGLMGPIVCPPAAFTRD